MVKLRVGSNIESEDDQLIQVKSRLEYLDYELECPRWMLGKEARNMWVRERAKLIELIRELDK